MAKTSKKDNKMMVTIDFTEYYNNIKEQQEKDKAEAAAYILAHQDDEKTPSAKLTFWQRIKNLFKRRK